MLLGALLAIDASPPQPLSLDIPPALAKAIRDAERSLSLPDHCAFIHTHRPLERDYYVRNARYETIWLDAVMIWGRLPEAPAGETSGRRRKPGCNRTAVGDALQQADLHLDAASRLLERSSVPLREGVWVGPLRLCRATVEHASIGQDWRGERTLTLSLTPAAKVRWAALTANRIGLPIAVRMAGTVISRPRILEPMTDGRLHIGASSASILDRARQMAIARC